SARPLPSLAGRRYSASVAKGTRRLRRAEDRARQPSGKERMAALKKPALNKPQKLPDPLGREQLKSMAVRLGLILLAVWMVGVLIAGVVTSSTGRGIALGIPAIITLGL